MKIIDQHQKFLFKKSFKKLIEQCLSNDPDERPSFDDIFNKLTENDSDFLLDNVSIEEVEDYIEYISDISESSEFLLTQNENKKLKFELNQLKKQNEKKRSF